jgi:hypothetical protein
MMSTSKKKFFSAVLCVGFLIACADSKKSSSDDGPATTGSEAVDEIVAAYCGTVRSCCAAEGHSTAPLANCEAIFSQAELLQAVLAERLAFREPERTECVAFIRGLAESCGSPNQDSPCYEMFEGVIDEGATCEDAEECRGSEVGAVCVHISVDDEAPGPGTCRNLSAGQVGSPCIRTIDEDDVRVGYSTSASDPPNVVCDRRAGLYCAYDSGTSDYSCQPLVGAGEPCDDFDSCPDGYTCEGTCVPQFPAGAACTAFGQCADGLECVNDVCAVPKLTDGDICEGDVT